MPSRIADVLAPPYTVACAAREPQPTPARAPASDLPPENLLAIEPETLDAVTLNISISPPANVAILHIQQDGAAAFRLRGDNAETPLGELTSTNFKKPHLALADFATSRLGPDTQTPKQIVQTFQQWSHTKHSLAAWIVSLIDRFGDDLFLVLDDQTGFEIPWELLYLRPTNSIRAVPLGSAVAIAHWQLVLDDRGTMLTAPHLSCSGSTLVYLSEKLETYDIEKTYFEALAPIQQTIRALRAALRQREIGVSLVYVACHGIFARATTGFALHGRDKSDVVCLADLDNDDDLRLLTTTHPVVFLNTCHSGRPLDDPYINDGYLRGFVELFLRKGAGGVLGTTGEVNTQFAADVAQRILNAARMDGGSLPLSVMLRDLRAEIVCGLPAEVDDGEQYRKLIWSSMYLYFGDPLTNLEVHRRA